MKTIGNSPVKRLLAIAALAAALVGGTAAVSGGSPVAGGHAHIHAARLVLADDSTPTPAGGGVSEWGG